MHIKLTLQESLEEMETHPKLNLVIEKCAEGNYDGIPPKRRAAESWDYKMEEKKRPWVLFSQLCSISKERCFSVLLNQFCPVNSNWFASVHQPTSQSKSTVWSFALCRLLGWLLRKDHCLMKWNNSSQQIKPFWYVSEVTGRRWHWWREPGMTDQGELSENGEQPLFHIFHTNQAEMHRVLYFGWYHNTHLWLK